MNRLPSCYLFYCRLSVCTYQREVSVGRNSHFLTSLFITRKIVQVLFSLLLPLLTWGWNTRKNSPFLLLSFLVGRQRRFLLKVKAGSQSIWEGTKRWEDPVVQVLRGKLEPNLSRFWIQSNFQAVTYLLLFCSSSRSVPQKQETH